MSITLPITAIYDSIVALFEAEEVSCSVVLGPKEPFKQINQGTGRANRVVMEPTVGEFVGAITTNGNPRVLDAILESCNVYVWAYDETSPNSYRAQYEACQALLNAVVRGIYLSAHGTFSLSGFEYSPIFERGFGLECKFVLQVKNLLIDAPWDVLPKEDEEGESNFEADLGFEIELANGIEDPND